MRLNDRLIFVIPGKSQIFLGRNCKFSLTKLTCIFLADLFPSRYPSFERFNCETVPLKSQTLFEWHAQQPSLVVPPIDTFLQVFGQYKTYPFQPCGYHGNVFLSWEITALQTIPININRKAINIFRVSNTNIVISLVSKEIWRL